MTRQRLFQAALALALWSVSAAKLAAVAPAYTASSIVHAASGVSSILVPNGLATIYGTNLSAIMRSVTADEVRAGSLPTMLISTGVNVKVNGVFAHILYVSPSQVNFLVPGMVTPGPATVELTRTGLTGGPVQVLVAESAPGLFLLKPGLAVATRPDGTVVTGDSPAAPGSVVALYATGLGPVVPAAQYGKLATSAAWLRDSDRFRVIIDGRTVTDGILYAGLAPGFAGLYQVNLRLPEWTGPNPEIRLFCGDAASPTGVRLPVAEVSAATHPAQSASTQ